MCRENSIRFFIDMYLIKVTNYKHCSNLYFFLSVLVKFEYFRELDGNLINEEGVIKFTNNNFEERIVAELDKGNIYEILVEGITTVTVEAGEFECINSERYYLNLEGRQLSGLDRFYYANGFGLIYDTISLIQNPIPSVIRSLVSYNVQ